MDELKRKFIDATESVNPAPPSERQSNQKRKEKSTFITQVSQPGNRRFQEIAIMTVFLSIGISPCAQLSA